MANREFETQNSGNGFIDRTINSIRRRYEDILGNRFSHRTSTYAERQILGEGDINQKIVNVLTRIININGITFLTDVPLTTGPHTANLNFGVSPCGIPQMPPPPGGGPLHFIEIDFLRTPLPEIQRQLQELGQYGHLSTQAGFREYETQKRLLDTLHLKIISGTMLENVQESLYEQNFLSLKWHDPNDPYRMRQELENIINLNGFGNPETKSLIVRWFTESQRSAGNPTVTAQIDERKNMAFNYLGRRNIPKADIIREEKQIQINKSKFEEMKTYCDSIDNLAYSVSQFHLSPPPGTIFNNIEDQINFLMAEKSQVNQEIRDNGRTVGGVFTPFTTTHEITARQTRLRYLTEELTQSKTAEREQTDLMKKTQSFLDIFYNNFNAPLTAAGAIPASITALHTALTTASAAGATKAQINALSNLLTRNNLQLLIAAINIDNANPTLTPNPWMIITSFIETQENNLSERKKMVENTTTFSPQDFLFAYERATNHQKGIRDEETLRVLAFKSTEMQLMQAEKAKFQSALNREFSQQVLNREQHRRRSGPRRILNTIRNLTSQEYEADELFTALTRYSSRHYKALKDIQIDSSEQEMREAITNNNLKYNDLRIIWETFYDIFIDRKIKGVDGSIEIADSSWQPVRNFVDNIQKIYIDLKTEDFIDKWNNGIQNPPPAESAAPETIPEAKNDIQKYQNIIEKQEEEQKAANDDYRANIDKIREYVGDFRKFLTDGPDFNKRIKTLEKKTETKTLTEPDKTFLESLTGLKPEHINFRTLVEKGLFIKELVDIGIGIANMQKDNLKKKAIDTGAHIKNKTISSAKYTKETTVKLGKKTGSLAWRTTKAPFKAAWWTIKAPFRLIKGVGYTGPRYVVRKMLKK